MLTSRSTRKSRFGTGLLVSLGLSLALLVAGSALPALDQEAAAADSIGCSAHATSFAPSSVDVGADFRMGCAGDAGSLRSLTSSDDDVVAAIDFDTTPNPELWLQKMQDVVDATRTDQANGLSLSDSFAQQAQKVSVGYYPQQPDGINYDGSIRVVGNSLVIVVPTADLSTTDSFWENFSKKFVLNLSILAIGVLVAAACLLVIPAAIPVCGAVSGGLSTGIGEIISARQDGKPIDGAAWGGILGTAIWGAIGGALGGALISYVEGNIASLILQTQATLKRLAIRFAYWALPIQYVSDVLNGSFAAALLQRLRDLQRGVGSTTLPTGTTLRVMVVGDSMTQGREGDWTWRYRLWQWFADQGVAVDFVGPYKGTREPDLAHPPIPPLLQGQSAALSDEVRTEGRYANETAPFDSDHFAVWGRQAAQDKNLIKDQVVQFQPDLLLVGLGFNDMGWFASDAEGTIASMKTLVDQARAAKPDIDIALANVPQRTLIDGREDLPLKTKDYNGLLRDAIPSWSTASSPVKLVDWAGNYSCGTDSCRAGYDGLHPNALGEFQIARAYELALRNGWGLGGPVPDVPADVPARPATVPGNVEARATPLGITVTWSKVFGARAYTVRSRVVGSNWTESSQSMNRFDTSWTKDGWQWEYQVRTDNATDGQSDWSPIVTAVAHPETAPPPVGIVTDDTATGLDISWDAPTGPYTDTIDRYQIIIWDRDTPGAYTESTAVQGLSARIDGLVPGHRYSVWVVTWNAGGQGFPGSARPVTVGVPGTPPAPTGLQVTSIDGTTVQLTWNASSGAAGYRIWVRNINDGSVSTANENSTTMDTSVGVAYLFPGVWNYEFCVTAINGSAESGKSNCVVAPHPPPPTAPTTPPAP